MTNKEDLKVFTKNKSQSLKNEAKDFLKNFKAFALKGDVLDLAIGVVIGGAFNKVVQSLTNDIIMPIFGKFLGNSSFSSLFINLSDKNYETLESAIAAGAPVIKYGLFITNILDFFIVSLTIFIVLRYILRKKAEDELGLL